MENRTYELGASGGPTVTLHELSAGPGPTVAVLGGVHGDEYEGMLVARRLLTKPPALQCGRLLIVTVANPSAHGTGTRTSGIDGGNLARSFPGSATGMWSERLAHLLTEHVISQADILVDVHSAGLHFEMPPLVGAVSTGPVAARSIAAARLIGMPFVWLHDEIAPGRTLSAAHDLGVAPVYIELPGGPTPNARWMDVAYSGLVNLIETTMSGALEETMPSLPTGSVEVSSSGDLDTDVVRAEVGGLFLSSVAAGDFVAEGQPIGTIVDPASPHLEPTVAVSPVGGHVMLLRRTARIHAGEALASFGIPVDPGSDG